MSVPEGQGSSRPVCRQPRAAAAWPRSRPRRAGGDFARVRRPDRVARGLRVDDVHPAVGVMRAPWHRVG